MEYVTLKDDQMTLRVPPKYRNLGVYREHLARCVPFRIPIHPTPMVDLTECDIYINFINARGKTGRQQITEIAVDDDHIIFSWELDSRIFVQKGVVKYIVCAMRREDGDLVYEWNTSVVATAVMEGCEVEDGQEEVPLELPPLLTAAEEAKQTLQAVIDDSELKVEELGATIDAFNEATDAETYVLRLGNIETALLAHNELATALVDIAGTMIETEAGFVLGAEDEAPCKTALNELVSINSYLVEELDAARMRIRVLEADQTSANADISDINASLDDMQTSVSAIEGTSVNMQNDISALQDMDSISTQRLDNIEVAMLTHTELSAALIDASGTMLETSAGYVLGADDSLPDAQQDYCDYLRDELDSARMRIRTLESAVMALQATVSALTA